MNTMNNSLPPYPRILGIYPSTRGFGFALVEGLNLLVKWGVKSVSGDKNVSSLAKVKEMITECQPDVLVLEDTSVLPLRRALRIRALTKQIVALAKKQKVRVFLYSPAQVKQVFFASGIGTKYALADMIAQRFPDELGFSLPPKRKPWMSEDSRMGIFSAVALTLTLRHHLKRSPTRAAHNNG